MVHPASVPLRRRASCPSSPTGASPARRGHRPGSSPGLVRLGRFIADGDRRVNGRGRERSACIPAGRPETGDPDAGDQHRSPSAIFDLLRVCLRQIALSPLDDGGAKIPIVTDRTRDSIPSTRRQTPRSPRERRTRGICGSVGPMPAGRSTGGMGDGIGTPRAASAGEWHRPVPAPGTRGAGRRAYTKCVDRWVDAFRKIDRSNPSALRPTPSARRTPTPSAREPARHGSR
jgi:hypothetical protein